MAKRLLSLLLVFLSVSTNSLGDRSLSLNHHRFLFEDEADSNNVLLPQKPNGDISCPCLSKEEYESMPFVPTIDFDQTFGSDFDYSTYGLFCAPHDLGTEICDGLDKCTSMTPIPTDCDKTFCQRSWCYIDPNNCKLLNKPSIAFKDMHYSYASCGYMDQYTHTELISSLEGKTLNVAFNSNTGGWMGAYNPEGSFATNKVWNGPVVEFIMEAAQRGKFFINITQPPEWLRSESQKFFGNSSFDYCVYATSLGYLDFCVAAYTITAKRASVTTFFEVGMDPVYLITFTDRGGSALQNLFKSFLTIFQPFTVGSWIMIMFVCLPILGLLMLFHEYGSPGSVFPDKVEPDEDGSETKKVDILDYVPNSLYMSYLSFFSGGYDLDVSTMGGKLNLLAIVSFVVLVMAVYTANLAAFLTQEAAKDPVGSVDEALRAGYNFCAARRVAERITQLYNIDSSKIVPDPIHLGGDGKPGFNCPDCASRSRVFDFMRQEHSDPSLYCNAAFASLEDIQKLHHYGRHCDKKEVGNSLAIRNMGIPMSDGISEPLMAWLYQMKYDGILDEEIKGGMPESQCSESEDEEEIQLTVEQLMGIWVITFSFAAAGVVAKLILPNIKLLVDVSKSKHFDQWGNPVNSEDSCKNLKSKSWNEIELLRLKEEQASNDNKRTTQFAEQYTKSDQTHITILKCNTLVNGKFSTSSNAVHL